MRQSARTRRMFIISPLQMEPIGIGRRRAKTVYRYPGFGGPNRAGGDHRPRAVGGLVHITIYLCQFHTGFPLSSRSTSVSVPFTTSRARIRSAPSCLTFEPVRLTSSPLAKDDPISSRNDLGQRYTSKVLSPLFRVKRAPSFSLPFSGNFNSCTVPFILVSVVKSYLGRLTWPVARGIQTTPRAKDITVTSDARRNQSDMAPPADKHRHECNAAYKEATIAGMQISEEERNETTRRQQLLYACFGTTGQGTHVTGDLQSESFYSSEIP